ncbi:33250_t:CDS:1, partial [Gigaspora margarita]
SSAESLRHQTNNCKTFSMTGFTNTNTIIPGCTITYVVPTIIAINCSSCSGPSLNGPDPSPSLNSPGSSPSLNGPDPSTSPNDPGPSASPNGPGPSPSLKGPGPSTSPNSPGSSLNDPLKHQANNCTTTTATSYTITDTSTFGCTVTYVAPEITAVNCGTYS